MKPNTFSGCPPVGGWPEKGKVEKAKKIKVDKDCTEGSNRFAIAPCLV